MESLASPNNEDVYSLCKEIVNYDSQIHDVIVINKNGKILELVSAKQDTVLQNMDSQAREMLFMEFALRQRMREEFNEYYGSVVFTCAQRQNGIMYSVPLEDTVFVIIANKIDNLMEFGQKITEKIKNVNF